MIDGNLSNPFQRYSSINFLEGGVQTSIDLHKKKFECVLEGGSSLTVQPICVIDNKARPFPVCPYDVAVSLTYVRHYREQHFNKSRNSLASSRSQRRLSLIVLKFLFAKEVRAHTCCFFSYTAIIVYRCKSNVHCNCVVFFPPTVLWRYGLLSENNFFCRRRGSFIEKYCQFVRLFSFLKIKMVLRIHLGCEGLGT